MRVRRATKENVGTLLQWFELPHASPFLRKPSHTQITAALEHPNKALFIVEDDGKPVAHFALLDLDNSRIVNLGIVLAAQQRRGYGKFAVQCAQRFAFIENQARRLWLEVTTDNVAARMLYEACGFVREGIWRDGFPADDGTFKDLAAYGMLAREYKETP
ncbi:MAG: GNAT family N-acetyltransferase [Candidatus Eremiobacteraeota bacterium]|nr:GNAT family N-acetyltransferase [Candidatus Eremiobacteraeota bacterium]